MIAPGGAAMALLCAAAALLCLLPGGPERAAWRWVAVLLAAIAVERLLHLEASAARAAAAAAMRGGWYGARRPYQLAVVVALAGLVAVAVPLGMHRLRGRGWPVRLAAAAALALAGFVLLRAVSLHQVDALLGRGVGPLRLANLVELGLLLPIGIAAGAALARNRGG